VTRPLRFLTDHRHRQIRAHQLALVWADFLYQGARLFGALARDTGDPWWKALAADLADASSRLRDRSARRSGE
jgi:hypothetical protein